MHAQAQSCTQTPPTKTVTTEQVADSRLNVGAIQIRPNGDLAHDGATIVLDGAYVGAPTWPCQLSRLLTGGTRGNGRRLMISIGKAGNNYAHIKQIYRAHGQSFAGSNLQRNLLRLYRTLGAVDLIELTVDTTNDPSSFIAFCQMLEEVGYKLSLFSSAGVRKRKQKSDPAQSAE